MRVHFEEEKTDDAPTTPFANHSTQLLQLPESAFQLPGSQTWSLNSKVASPVNGGATLSHPEPALPSDSSREVMQFQPIAELPTPSSFNTKVALVPQVAPSNNQPTTSKTLAEDMLPSAVEKSAPTSSAPASNTETTTQPLSDSLQSFLKASAGFAALNAASESSNNATAMTTTSAQQLASDLAPPVNDQAPAKPTSEAAAQVSAFDIPRSTSFVDLLNANITKQASVTSEPAVSQVEVTETTKPPIATNTQAPVEPAPALAVAPETIVTTTAASTSNQPSSQDADASVESFPVTEPLSADSTPTVPDTQAAQAEPSSAQSLSDNAPVVAEPTTATAQSTAVVEPQPIKQTQLQSAGPKLASNRPATPLTKPSNLVPTPQAAAASQPVNPVVKPEPSQPQPIKDATPTEAVVKASKAPTTNTADDSKPISQPASIKFDQSKDLPTASKPTVTPQATSDVQQPAKDDSSSSPPPVAINEPPVVVPPVTKPTEQSKRFEPQVVQPNNAAAQTLEPATVAHVASQAVATNIDDAEATPSNSADSSNDVSSQTQDDAGTNPTAAPTLAARIVRDALPIAAASAPVAPTTNSVDRNSSPKDTTDSRKVDTVGASPVELVAPTSVTSTSSSPVQTTDSSSFKPLFDQTTSGPLAEPGTAVTQVVSAMQQAVDSNEKLRVHLNPPELGTVLVEVSRSPHGIVAKIEFSNAGTQQAVQTSLPELHRALAQSGIVMDRVEVTIRDQKQEAPERQPRDERGRQQQGFNQSRQEQSRQQQRRAGRPSPNQDEETFERAA